MFVLIILSIETNTKTPDESNSKAFINHVEKKRRVSESVDHITTLIENQRTYDSLYKKIIGFMKKNEGYRSHPYRCLAGAYTVGYGHVIRPDDSLSYPLSKSQADSLLREDFDRRIEFIEKDLDLDRLEEPHKVLSLAHFIFNVGQGNFKDSMLYQTLKHTGELSESIKNFIHIKTQDGYVESDHLLKMRKFEYKLFNKRA
jgi:lysozyme